MQYYEIQGLQSSSQGNLKILSQRRSQDPLNNYVVELCEH